MSTPQLLMGRRASDGVYAVFLSRQGVDVNYALDADLLISPFNANMMILTRGIIYVPYGTVQTVYFPEAVANPPLVFFDVMNGSLYTTPLLSYYNAIAGNGVGDRFDVATYTDRITIYNRASSYGYLVNAPNNDLYMRYFVVAKDALP